MKHLRTAGYEPAHFFIRDPVKFHGVGVQPGVFVVNAVHVGVDLAHQHIIKKKNTVEEWDSVHQLNITALLEELFDILFDPEDIMALTSYDKGIEILKKYQVEI